jgi:hypothetical protein
MPTTSQCPGDCQQSNLAGLVLSGGCDSRTPISYLNTGQGVCGIDLLCYANILNPSGTNFNSVKCKEGYCGSTEHNAPCTCDTQCYCQYDYFSGSQTVFAPCVPFTTTEMPTTTTTEQPTTTAEPIVTTSQFIRAIGQTNIFEPNGVSFSVNFAFTTSYTLTNVGIMASIINPTSVTFSHILDYDFEGDVIDSMTGIPSFIMSISLIPSDFAMFPIVGNIVPGKLEFAIQITGEYNGGMQFDETYTSLIQFGKCCNLNNVLLSTYTTIAACDTVFMDLSFQPDISQNCPV